MPGLLRRVQSWRGSSTKPDDTSYNRSESDSYLLNAISEDRPASCSSLKSGVTRSTKASSTAASRDGMQPHNGNADSLLGKLTKRLGRGSHRKSPQKSSLPYKADPKSVGVNTIRLFPTTESIEVKLDEDVQHAVRLDLRAEQEENLAQYKTALQTLEEALSVSDNNRSLETKFRCKMASLHLKLDEEKDRSCDHVEAARLLLDKVNFAGSRKVEKWLSPSPQMLKLLMGGRKWESALVVANQLKSTSALCLARLHFEIAMNQNDFDQHIQECHQLLLSVTKKEAAFNEQDANTLFDLWQDLAEAYTFKEDYDIAARCHESMLTFLTDATEIARVHYQFAIRICIPCKDAENAMAHIDAALNALKSIEDRTSAFYFTLLRMKAEVLCRVGRMEESLELYEKLATALHESPDHSPADVANVLYTMGKLCIREKGYDRALKYFQRELQMTSSVVGMNHMAVSRILHEIASVADHGLGDHELALSYLRSALEVETNVLNQCLKEEAGKKAAAGASAVAPGRLAAHSRRDSGSNSSPNSLLQDARYQISETQRCMGRIHYKMGDFESAMRLSMEIPVL